jgi:addiction module RelE/StbE family toxin
MSRNTRLRAATSPASLQWTERALRDLCEIEDYIAAHNPAAAERWIARLIVTAEAAAAAPQSCRMVPEIAEKSVREALLRNYRIVYRVRDLGIVVLTVFEGHRLLPPDVVGKVGDDE